LHDSTSLGNITSQLHIPWQLHIPRNICTTPHPLATPHPLKHLRDSTSLETFARLHIPWQPLGNMFLLLLVGFTTLIILYLRRNYGSLEKMGIAVIKPSIFGLGSYPVFLHKYLWHETEFEIMKKMGKVWGAYQGSEPWVVVADPAMLKEICVKSFDHFPNHGYSVAELPKKIRTVLESSDQEWKELRKNLTPTFTSGKIKGMLEPMGAAQDNMVKYLEKKCKENSLIDMKPVFQYMAMDVIASCAFGIDLNCFEDPNNHILDSGQKLIAGTRSDGYIFDVVFHLIQSIQGIDKLLNIFPVEYYRKMWDISKKIQDQRISSGTSTGIFMDRLIDLRNQVKNGQLPNISEDQITGQGIIFFTAGFETTANTLTTLCYNLVKNTQVLETLQEEIDNMLSENDDRIDHETVSAMPYLEACLKENLRMCPPVARNDRTCSKDFQYKNIKIPGGTEVAIPIYTVHHDEDNFPDPEAFQPTRFLKENADKIIPGSFLPFGIGPRACIGERFAMVEMKIAMVKLLNSFRIEMAEETKLDVFKGDTFLFTYPNMYVNVYKK